jgi:polar amino acid transport system ATP-binding protein
MGLAMSQLASRKPPTLLLTDVVKTYPGGHQALKGVSLQVNPSEVVAVVGPSGCGKSTLLRTINGLETIEGGSIALNGEVITRPGTAWPAIRQRVGMVFQQYDLFPHLTVLGNLLVGPLKVAKENKTQAGERALLLLRRVALEERAGAYPRQLSGGQQQRVAIVRALMMQPEVLLLDEITAALDPEMVREVLDVVLGLARDGMTMVIVTHEMAFARAIADRVVFMDEGRVVEEGEPERFFTAPSSPRAQQFLQTFVFDSVRE